MLREYVCFGVIGNCANHLAQAKEADDFAGICNVESAPKGIFPFYCKDASNFLNRYCIDDKKLEIVGEFAQVEPELALLFDAGYDAAGNLSELKPHSYAAFNDTSLRIKAPKLSQKKNFSEHSKGLGNILPLKDFDEIKNHKISSFVKRDGKWHEYGTSEYVKDYYYYAAALCEWAIEVFNSQEDVATLENLRQFLATKPSKIMLCIGATPYTDFGNANYLKDGDEVVVAVTKDDENVLEKLINNELKTSENISFLHQKVSKID